MSGKGGVPVSYERRNVWVVVVSIARSSPNTNCNINDSVSICLVQYSIFNIDVVAYAQFLELTLEGLYYWSGGCDDVVPFAQSYVPE